MAASSRKNPKWMSITGWVLTVVVFLFMGVMPVMMFTTQRDKMEQQSGGLGFDKDFVPVMVALEIGCALIYVFPKTALLGAILLTGYLGGAVCTHLRMHQREFFFAVIFGMVVWLALFLRDGRVRDLVPWRK